MRGNDVDEMLAQYRAGKWLSYGFMLGCACVLACWCLYIALVGNPEVARVEQTLAEVRADRDVCVEGLGGCTDLLTECVTRLQKQRGIILQDALLEAKNGRVCACANAIGEGE